jgi:uncharacterized protein (DUF433 family)
MHNYCYLAPKPRSRYRQLFVKDRWVAARTLYGMYMSEEEPLTPEEIAADFQIPIEAVREAIAYCQSNPPELVRDLAMDEATFEAKGMNDPNYNGRPRLLTPEERARINRL